MTPHATTTSQQQLKDAQSQSEAMKAANASLREETASSQARLDRTVEALRLAGRNAAAARANADAAEATATTLSQTLQALQTVIAETKRASQLLHHEQESVTAKAALVETKLLQKQGDLARANQELEQLRHSNADMERSQRTWSDERHRLEHLVKQHQAEVAEAKRAALEHLALEDARKQRADKVALELHQAQTLLTLATAGQAAAEQTQVVLKESLTSLQQSHTELHQSMQTQQEASRNDQQRLLETVHKLERDTQRLRIAAETSNEEIQRLRLDKRTAEQQIAHLQKQLNSSSRSSTEVQQTHSSDPITSSSSTEVTMISPPIHSATPTTHLSFHLPPLTVAKQQAPLSASTAPTIISSVTDKENEGVSNGVLCCLCFKHTSGMMKNCQCGDGSCRKRAHWNCVKGSGAPGPSVSHPGTPAPPLPVVLCGRGAVRRDRMSSLSSTNHNQKTPSSSVAVNGASTRDA